MNKTFILGSLSAVTLMMAVGTAAAHVGYGTELYNQSTNTWGPTGAGGFNPTVSSNAGWISGMSDNGVNRTATVDTLADSHNNRARFFSLDQTSNVSITVTGTANTFQPGLGLTPSILNPGFSLFSEMVPAGSHDGAGDRNGLTPAQITAMQSPAMVGTALNTPGDGGYLQNLPAFATWSPFFDTMDEIIPEGGGAVDAGGPNWGVYQSDGDVTMGNNNGEVSTMTFTGIAVGDGHDGDVQDNRVTWTGTLGPGIYSLFIGGANQTDLASLFEEVQQGTPIGCTDVSSSCNGTNFGNPSDPNNPAATDPYFKLRGARNMHISMAVNGDVSPVPVPAAAYLFGTGLIGLAGMARRKMMAR
ncbi:MAG: VPLPA-CTERM sorting domain-containing protein [Nitrospira sp.]